jgi:hypothetical protein
LSWALENKIRLPYVYLELTGIPNGGSRIYVLLFKKSVIQQLLGRERSGGS